MKQLKHQFERKSIEVAGGPGRRTPSSIRLEKKKKLYCDLVAPATRYSRFAAVPFFRCTQQLDSGYHSFIKISNDHATETSQL